MTRRYASEDDLRQADLSRIPDHKMTEQEKAEMQRRMREFMTAMKPKPKAKAEKPKPKVTKWTPRAVRPGGGG
ncbi:MAG: hypothetical protein AAF684_03040 [Pseudomonadota bacterium]